MFTKNVKLRITFFIFLITLFAIIVVFVLKSLEENVVYFFSPTEIYNKNNISLKEKIRIGGLVKKNSIEKNNETISFIITDLKNEIVVSYIGLVPNLFSEEKGVVAEGSLRDKKYFIADKILAKHDENYMPPEVSKALDKAN
jgi:cytochrome c-type biogenesis protein CcmE